MLRVTAVAALVAGVLSAGGVASAGGAARPWQTPDPQTEPDTGYVSTANGVVYAGANVATGTNMYGLDAGTGTILWSFASGGSVDSGAAIVSQQIYWGTGYRSGEADKFYAFSLPAAAPRRHG